MMKFILIFTIVFFVQISTYCQLDNQEVTLYLVYTDDAKNHITSQYGMDQPIATFFTSIEQNINKIFENSKVKIKIKFVKEEPSSLKNTINIKNDIKKFDGETQYTTIAEKTEYTRIKSVRSEIAADLVCLIGYNNYLQNIKTYGISPSPQSTDGKRILDPKYAFFIIDIGRFRVSNKDLVPIAFAHEIGHIFGLGHDYETAMGNNESKAQQGLTNKAHGYVIYENNLRKAQTVMAQDDRERTVDDMLLEEIPFFSNVTIPMSTVESIHEHLLVGDKTLKIGTENGPNDYDANAASVLNENACKYASFMTEIGLTPSCDGLHKTTTNTTIENFCGFNGCIATSSCYDMERCINGSCAFEFTNFDLYYPSELKQIHLNVTPKPIALFVQNKQTKIIEIPLSQKVTTTGLYQVQINFTISNKHQTLEYVQLDPLFKVETFVDGKNIATTLNCTKTSLETLTKPEKYSAGSLSEEVYLESGENKLQLLIISGDIETVGSVFTINSATVGKFTDADFDDDNLIPPIKNGTSSNTNIQDHTDYDPWNYRPCIDEFAPNPDCLNKTRVNPARWIYYGGSDCGGDIIYNDKVKIDWGDGATEEIFEHDGGINNAFYKDYWHQYSQQVTPYIIKLYGKELWWCLGIPFWGKWHELGSIKFQTSEACQKEPIIRSWYQIPAWNKKLVKFPDGKRLYVEATEVTQSEYVSIMRTVPFSAYGENKNNYPAENISWYDAILFCNKRSQLENLNPVYTLNGTPQFNGTGSCISLGVITADLNKNGYRLPSPEEWEYAYMAGTTTDYYWGSFLYKNDNCWGNDNSGGTTHPVGLKNPNPWGLFDMAGNVEEMTCTYGSTLLKGYAGGCFVNSSPDRISHNSNILVENMNPNRWLGFRVVRKAPADIIPILNLLLD